MPETYLATFAATGVALYVGHLLGDHAIQTSAWAAAKGQHSHEGRAACAKHVVTLTLAQMCVLAIVAVTTGADFQPAALIVGLALNGWTHYWFDRRFTARALYEAIGKKEFADLGSGANPLSSVAYRLDQDWHTAWLVPSALIIAAPTLGHVAALTALSALAMGAAITLSRSRRHHDRQLAA